MIIVFVTVILLCSAIGGGFVGFIVRAVLNPPREEQLS